MDIDRFERHHRRIIESIDRMRERFHADPTGNAADVAREILILRSAVLNHLRMEDSDLYPKLGCCADAELVGLVSTYQTAMGGVAAAFERFTQQWGRENGARIKNDTTGFKRAANRDLRALFERIQREEHELHPRLRKANL